MNDYSKTKEQLVEELKALRGRIASLEKNGSGVPSNFSLNHAIQNQEQWQAVLETVDDGILVVDSQDNVIYSNTRFAQMWRIPSSLIENKNDGMLLEYVLDQLQDTETFLKEVRRLYQSGEEQSDTLHFKDGRVFERFSRPLIVDNEIAGRVWCFSDRTEYIKAVAVVDEQNEFLHNVLEALSHPFYVIDVHDYTIQIANKATRFNETDCEKTCYKLTHGRTTPCDGIDHPCPIQEVIKNQKPYSVEHLHYDRDNNEQWIEIHAFPVFDKWKNVTQIIEYNLDITERKLFQKALLKSEKKYRELLETIPHGIQEIDLSGTIVFANSANHTMLGYGSGELIGKSIFSLMTDDDEKIELHKYIEEIIRNPVTPVPYFTKNYTKDGKIIEIQVDWNYKRDESGKLTGFISVLSDVSYRKRDERELIKHRYHLETIVARRTIELTRTNERLQDEINERKRIEEQLRQSEERLSLALEGANEGLWDWNVGTGIMYFSPRWYTILGYEPNEFKPSLEKWLELIHPSDRIKSHVLTRELLSRNQQSFEIEYRMKIKDGDWCWLSDRGKVTQDNERNQLRMTGTITDITGRKRAEEALRVSENRFRSLFEGSVDGIVFFDMQGRFKDCNLSFEKMLGYKKEELCQKSIYDVTPPEWHVWQRTQIIEKQLLLRGQTDTFEKEYIRKDGSVFPVELTAYKLEFPHMDKALFWGAVRDITERKQAESEIQTLNEELERRVTERTLQLEAANKELEAFSYSVSHDLRAPLGTIDGFSLALLEDYHDRLDENGRMYLERVRAGSQRMAQLIDDLLNLSRLSRAELEKKTIDLSELARSVSDELMADKDRDSIQFNIAPSLQCEGDVRLLRVVLYNLFGNAIKFTGKLAMAIIEFGITVKDREAVFFVRDNGAGFDMAYADKLFGAFQRLHSADEFEGSGIGLATVHRIIRRHGGRVWAEGYPGRGAVFYFTLL